MSKNPFSDIPNPFVDWLLSLGNFETDVAKNSGLFPDYAPDSIARARNQALNDRFRSMVESRPEPYSGIPMRNQPAYQRPDSMARAMPIPNAKIGADPMADAQRMPYNPSSDSMESNMLPVTAPAKPDAGFDLGRWLGSLFGGK